MKRIYITLVAAILSVTAMAQEADTTVTGAEDVKERNVKASVEISGNRVEARMESTDSTGAPTDTTRLEFKKSYVTIIKTKKEASADSTAEDLKEKRKENKYELTFWNGIDLGVNGYLMPSGNINLDNAYNYLDIDYGKSRFLGINFLQVKGRIVKDYVGLTSGVTFQFHNYKFRNNQTLLFTNDTLTAFRDSSINMTKNKLRAIYFGIPLMLEFNTSQNPDKNFHISAGVVGKVLIGEMYKIKYGRDGDDFKDKTKQNLYFNTLQADAMLRVGYRNFTLFGTAGLLPLFDVDNAPELYSFAAGIFIKV